MKNIIFLKRLFLYRIQDGLCNTAEKKLTSLPGITLKN